MLVAGLVRFQPVVQLVHSLVILPMSTWLILMAVPWRSQ